MAERKYRLKESRMGRAEDTAGTALRSKIIVSGDHYAYIVYRRPGMILSTNLSQDFSSRRYQSLPYHQGFNWTFMHSS